MFLQCIQGRGRAALLRGCRSELPWGAVWAILKHVESSRISKPAYSTAAPSRLHFCVVGAGPAGFYTTDKLLKKYGERVRVDILDQLPTPFGLVRSGVAPDHPETKNVEHHFTEVAQDKRTTFLGNVTVGRDVQLAELRAMYSGVVLAYGAESDRRLGIPGEDAAGVLSARRFVWWYNGHPAGADVTVDLSAVRSVAVLGAGNVALDCVRLLLSPPERFSPTDVADRALQQLRASAVRHVHVIARRGPAQAACTPKELRELLGVAGQNVHINTEVQPASVPGKAGASTDRIRKRLLDIFRKAADASDPHESSLYTRGSGKRLLHFDFLRQPVEILTAADGRPRAVRTQVMQTQLAVDGSGRMLARGTGQFEEIPADLILVSIGYRSVPIPGAGFDVDRGVILHSAGRVLDSEGRMLHGVYACGWLSRGPSGIIGTNSANAELVAEVIGEDAEQLRLLSGGNSGTQALRDALATRGVCPTSFVEWEKIDAVELQRGSERAKTREKLATLPELLEIAGAGS